MTGQVVREEISSWYETLEHIWDSQLKAISASPLSSPSPSLMTDLVILGQTYSISKERTDGASGANEDTPHQFQNGSDGSVDMNECEGADEKPIASFNNIKAFFNKLSSDIVHTEKRVSDTYTVLPESFKQDLNTLLWFTYRCGFPLIERNKNGPSPLSLGSFFRGTLDLSTVSKGFTTDSGWGCMIRTSQSLLANAMLALKLGRRWRLHDATEEQMKVHWNIVEQFADSPESRFSIHNYVDYASIHCGKMPGEWFGPSDVAKSIQNLTNQEFSGSDLGLKVYLSTNSGDIFEDELLKLVLDPISTEFTPVLILCAVRLGVQNINPIYWDFLKSCLSSPYSVGISGGRPSSSHYFFGFQADCLFYLDPHIPQNAILLNSGGQLDDDAKESILNSVHTSKLRTLELAEMDPSMLIGFLLKSTQEYENFKKSIELYDNCKKFLNIYESRPYLTHENSAGSELDGFVDLGVESINDDLGDGGESRTPSSRSHTSVVEIVSAVMGEPKSASTENFSVIDANNLSIPDVDDPVTVTRQDIPFVSYSAPKHEKEKPIESDTRITQSEVANESMVLVATEDVTEPVLVEDPDIAEDIRPN